MPAKTKRPAPTLGTINLVSFTIVGVTPYSQSAPLRSEKRKDESNDDYDIRCWREHMHLTPDGRLFVPAMGVKFGLTAACMWIGDKIEGRGSSTYTARFEGGVMVTDQAFPLNVAADDVKPELLFMNADGKRGGGKRVWRRFPTIPPGWRAEGSFVVLDGLIDEARFLLTLETMGKFVGVGRFRPQKGGFYGRFNVENFTWKPYAA